LSEKKNFSNKLNNIVEQVVQVVKKILFFKNGVPSKSVCVNNIRLVPVHLSHSTVQP
jgi:hypothetical protein